MPSPSPSAQDASKKPAASRNRSPNRTSASTTPSANSSVNRIKSVKSSAGSPLSAKGAARKPSQASNGAMDDSKAETAALVDDLKEQLRKAEITSEEHQKEIYVLQSRLDEALNEQGKLEEKANEGQEMVEDLRKEKQDLILRNRDLTTAYENDKSASMKDREETGNREEELRGTIQRLKDTLAQRETSKNIEGEGKLSRTGKLSGIQANMLLEIAHTNVFSEFTWQIIAPYGQRVICRGASRQLSKQLQAHLTEGSSH